MSEVKKMYENAKVKPVCDGLDCFTCTAKCNNGKYPEFTAEKQIELIKWLINFDYTHLSKLYGADINFSVVLAATINYLWKCLSKSEQEQIRSILNGN